MKTIYFVRHAESHANADGIMAGQELETPLTDKGRQQAKAAGEFLKDKGIELIMVSPMERTRETASIIAKEIGLDKTRMIENKLILERAFGHYSGQPYEDYVRDAQQNQVTGDVEPPEDLFKRVSEAFAWLEARPETTILVVSHGATGRMFRLVDQKLSHDDFKSIQRFDNAEIDKFTL